MKSSKRFLVVMVVSFSALVLHYVLYMSPIGARLEWALAEYWFSLRGRLPAPEEVVIVAIDEESYQKLSLSPLAAWPRKLYAPALKKLASYGARGVVFDLVFQGSSQERKDDEALSEALRILPVVLGRETLQRVVQGPEGVETKTVELRPEEVFVKNARATARIGLHHDLAMVRRFLPAEDGVTVAPDSLAMVAAQLAGVPPRKVSVGDMINYYGPSGSLTTVPFYRLLDDSWEPGAELFKDKVVFIGQLLSLGAAGAAKDIFNTPVFGLAFGVEIHATAAANLIRGDWIKRFSVKRELSVLHLLLLLVTFALVLFRPWWGAGLFAAAVLAWAAGSYLAFKAGCFIPGLTAAAVVLPAVFVCSALYYYIITYRAQREIRAAFARYLPPAMVDRIAREPNALKLGGQLVEATVFFSDITGFTRLAEGLEPQQLSSMLNRYFTEVGDIILAHGGTLLKFIGDGLFALWGAPLPALEGERQALQSAVLIQKRIEVLAKSGVILPMETRIGIHRGNVVVGNLGSELRFDYTAIGDAVNLASRLEELNKRFGTSILATEMVIEQSKSQGNAFPLGLVKVFGREKAIRVYTVFPEWLSGDAERLWKEAIELFESRQWNEAKAAFESIGRLELRLKKAAAIYLEAIESHLSYPPSRNWQGEVAFIEK